MSEERDMDLRGIEDAFKLNIGGNIDRMLDIVTGNYRTPTMPGEPDRITRNIKESQGWEEHAAIRDRHYTGSSDTEERTVNRREASAPIYREVSNTPKIPPKYAQLFKELDRFHFSDNEEKFNQQMEVVIAGIRSSLQDLVIKDVAKNTRTAFGDYVKDIFKVSGGIKVNFEFDGFKVTVSARGPFSGDETVCVSRKGDKVAGSVMRVDEHGKSDLTANFGMTIGE